MKEQKKAKKMQKHNVKSIKGITLIALVITIVVLLILAAVSITAVFGDNGLLQMAKDSAEKTNEAAGKEQEEMNNVSDILGEYTNGGNGDSGDETEPPTEVTLGNTQEKYIDIGETFTIKVKDSTEEITVSTQDGRNEVVTVAKNTVTGKKVGDATLTVTWNENNSATINVHVYDPTTIGAPKRIEDYGKIVVDYKDTENTRKYRLFYQDKNYTYIISDESISLGASLEEKYGIDYPNGASIKENSIGQRLNPMLKNAKVNNEDYTFFDAQNTNDNIKAVGYLTDPEKWTKYANGEEDVFAIGGPTIELFAASYNTMSTEEKGSGKNIIPKVKQYGYSENTSDSWLTEDQREGIYNSGLGRNWWLVSPIYSFSYYVFDVREIDGYLGGSGAAYSANAVRPLVCIPTSKFNEKYGENLKWETELEE